jgi:hypothetical protein
MAVEVSDAVLHDTPPARRDRQRWFTETTMDWFRVGEQISENPVDGEYQEPPSRRAPFAIHAAAISVGLSCGLLVAWLVL